jgi:LexA-binding, inner membrane-associated putative hydrolase
VIGPQIRPADAVAAILVIDGAFSSGVTPRGLIAPADEGAHLLTTYLFLDLIEGHVSPSFRRVALASSVLLDLDHLSRLMRPPFRPRTRPRPHSIATVLGAMLLSRWLPRRHRPQAYAVAFGIVSHLVRDVARGSAPLGWPITGRGVSVPYIMYSASLYASAWMSQTVHPVSFTRRISNQEHR